MTAELNEEILGQAGIGAFFRPSQLEPLGIPYRRLRQLEADETVERVGWVSTGLPMPSPRNAIR